MSDMVSVKPLKDKFLEKEVVYGRGYTSEICKRLGFIYKDGSPDTQRIKRKLGITQKQKGKFNKHMHYNDAVVLCRAMGLDPVDVDL